MKIILSLFSALLLSSLLMSQTYTVSAVINGTNEVPPNGSAGTGTLTGTYDAETNSIVLSVTYANLTTGVTSSHLHKAPPGVNGGVIIGLAPPVGMISGTYGGTYSVLAADEPDLIAGNVYVNIHSSTYPGGEIRGQLELVPDANCEIEIEIGDLCVKDNSHGVVLKSPNGTCYRIMVDDLGNIISSLVNCP